MTALNTAETLRQDSAHDVIPFVVTVRPNLSHLRLDLDWGAPMQVIDAADPARRDFCMLMNHTNHLAFGGDGMGMPLWVLLDCGILPSAVVGYALPRARVSEALWQQVSDDRTRDTYDDPLVPLAEYCACPTLEPHCVSGFSLQSQLTRQGLGTRTKALAMLVYGARAVVGVTQFTNPSIRAHARFGPLELLVHRPVVHTHAANSFTYRLELPADEVLLAMARGELERVDVSAPDGEPWAFNPASEDDHARLKDVMSAGARVWIEPPGWLPAGDGNRLSLRIG